MSDTTQENDPSIEEILASIRQIISDDDEENQDADAPVEDEVVEEPEQAAPEEEDVLELTDKVDEDSEPEEEQELAPEPEPKPEPEPEPEEEVIEELEDDIEVDLTEHPEETVSKVEKNVDTESLLSDTAATAALAGFTKLARDIQVNRTFDGITLEDIVRAQLEPLLREWLDKNLPPMIEVLVEKELEKLSKKALND